MAHYDGMVESNLRAENESLRAEVKGLRQELERIMFMGMDCPPMADRAEFYRNGMMACVSVAAAALKAKGA